MNKVVLVLSFSCLVISANCFAQSTTITSIEFKAGQDGKPYRGKNVNNTIPGGRGIFNDTLNNFYNALATYCTGLNRAATQAAEGQKCFTKMPVKDRPVAINGKTSTATSAVTPEDCECVTIPKLPTPPSTGGGSGGTTGGSTGGTTGGTTPPSSTTSAAEQESLISSIF